MKLLHDGVRLDSPQELARITTALGLGNRLKALHAVGGKLSVEEVDAALTACDVSTSERIAIKTAYIHAGVLR